MSASTYAGNAILSCFLRGIAPTPPDKVYVALHTANPGNAGVNEVTLASWPGYVRRDAGAGGAASTAFVAVAGKATENSKEMLWPAHDGAVGIELTHFSLWDHPTAGNCLFYGPLTQSKMLGPSDEFILYPGALDVAVQ